MIFAFKGVEKITKNSSVLYSPTTGFTLDNVPNPTGTYRCILDEQNQDVVTILVKNSEFIYCISSNPCKLF